MLSRTMIIKRRARRMDLTGQRFGRLVVIGRADDWQKRGRFRCRCDCGTVIETLTGSLRSGNTQSCGCLRVDRFREARALPYGEGAWRKALHTMKANARSRGISWQLTDAEARALCASDCEYCGSPPSNRSKSKSGTGDHVYNGIDRADSSLGYQPDNVVPCCFVCNNAKRTMSVSEFEEWIECVYTRLLVKSHESRAKS